jgi:predicted CXXCH cytochrome family protein
VHGTAPGLLRGNKSGAAFCFSCHDRRFFEQMKDRGTSLQQTGHFVMGSTPGSQVDSLSLQCIACHENESDALGIRMGKNNIVLHNSGGANHPIGMRYPANPGRDVNLRPKGALPRAILLPDGRMSCVSCHQVYKKDHGKLVMPNEGSALCLQCHNV